MVRIRLLQKANLNSKSSFLVVLRKNSANDEEKISVVTKGTDNEKGGSVLSFFPWCGSKNFSSNKRGGKIL